jgi:hypothetical protein
MHTHHHRQESWELCSSVSCKFRHRRSDTTALSCATRNAESLKIAHTGFCGKLYGCRLQVHIRSHFPSLGEGDERISQQDMRRLVASTTFTCKQSNTSRNQGTSPLHRTVFPGEAVEHSQLLLILLRLLSRQLLGRVSLVYVIFREDGEVPPVPAALLELHLLDDARV